MKTPDMARLQAMAESLMTDRFRVTRYTGDAGTDPDTGVSTPTHRIIWQGRGRLQTSGGVAADKTTMQAGATGTGGLVSEWSLYLHLPVTAVGLRERDLAECTDSRDPDLVGRRFLLVNMQSEKTLATARRWNVREIPNPERGGPDAAC